MPPTKRADTTALHVLVLTDRDWSHPQAGGTGASLLGHVGHWLAWGHRVTVLASSYPGALACERHGRLTVFRRGGRVTVFPHTIWRLARGLVPDADVAVEIINGITFLTPLWLGVPRVAYVHHIHRGQYETELGTVGRLAGFLAETLPLRWLYRRGKFVTVSHATADDLSALGINANAIQISYSGPDPGRYGPGKRAPEPTLLYLGRLKRYKRIELLLDVLGEIPHAVLDIAGDGDHRAAVEAAIAARGLGNRVRVHGHVDEQTKLALLQRAWAVVTASSAEGWGLSVLEAAACATPAVALAVGGLTEAILDGHTGLLAHDGQELTLCVRRVLVDSELRERLGRNALLRTQKLNWEHSAERTLDVLARELPAVPATRPRVGAARPATLTLARILAAASLVLRRNDGVPTPARAQKPTIGQ